MYIAMNRFKIIIGREKDFEKIWKNRETHLDDVTGFIEFHLVKGKTEETYTLYASHSTWKSQNDFSNWTKSKEFRQAHKGAGKHSDIYLGHPVFEGFEVITL
ncbi:MAG: Heme oxygenase (staphylobilin-producing) [Alphaproteobacteria bacterium MarineAlpha9_Bin3]|nr:MAG: Heme oxygenase (staphylobilin-producing) [Alphaproteobacteria bacterium MarineAlpha9_Bin3]|tara:strand:+ start:177 stop:482 length:306 start_codon:yes stop_codon:yes gene_type:complete